MSVVDEILLECAICFMSGKTDRVAIIMDFCGSICTVAGRGICLRCATLHIQTTLNACYAGVLPKIRCPLCLTNVTKLTWQPLVPEKLVQKYEQLCERSCSFRTPCCDDFNYTHLPKVKHLLDDVDNNDEYTENHTEQRLPCEEREKIPVFRRKCQAFCRHKLSASTLYDAAYTLFGYKYADLILNRTLCRILDDERRATLLLNMLHRQPNILTRCHRSAICFNCLCLGHHHGSCTSVTSIRETKHIVQCPECHTNVMRLDECKEIVCVCGSHWDWEEQLLWYDRYRRELTPAVTFQEHLQWRHHYQSYQVGLRMIKM